MIERLQETSSWESQTNGQRQAVTQALEYEFYYTLFLTTFHKDNFSYISEYSLEKVMYFSDCFELLSCQLSGDVHSALSTMNTARFLAHVGTVLLAIVMNVAEAM